MDIYFDIFIPFTCLRWFGDAILTNIFHSRLFQKKFIISIVRSLVFVSAVFKIAREIAGEASTGR